MFSTKHPGLPWRRSLLLTGVAATAAVALLLVLRAAGADVEVTARGDRVAVPVGAVALATAVGGAAGHLLALVAARTARPRATFIACVVAGLAVSGVPPLRAGATGTDAVWLLVLHAVVAAVVVPPLVRALEPRAGAPAPTGAPAPDLDRARP